MGMDISIVIPLYNRADYIERALQSVQHQTYSRYEIIVVDDGSTDNGASLVEAWNDPRLRLIRQANAGVSVARNRGVEEARYAWIAFLDADDKWEPELLETLSRAVAQHPSVIAAFANYRHSQTGKPFLESCPEPIALSDYFAFCNRNRGSGMWTSACLIRKSALQEAGGFPPGVKHGQDIDTWGRLALTGTLLYVPKVLATYHVGNPESSMQRIKRAPTFPHFARTVRRLQQEGKIPASQTASIQQFVNRRLLWYANLNVDCGNYAEARRTLREECSLRYCPPAYYLRTCMGAYLPRGLMAMLRKARRHPVTGT
jgi:glycosyltransferase involved in cell wall biosynthesis